nr:serine protease [Cohnella sp. WQ 127256]
MIGNPLYFTQIANEGKILGMVPIQGRKKLVMALDAPVFNGNSGSPVINVMAKPSPLFTLRRRSRIKIRSFRPVWPYRSMTWTTCCRKCCRRKRNRRYETVG